MPLQAGCTFIVSRRLAFKLLRHDGIKNQVHEVVTYSGEQKQMPSDIKKLLEESREAIALLKSIGKDVPKEAEELVEVFERCLRSEAERDRLREAMLRHDVYHKTIEHDGHRFIVWQGRDCIAVIRHPDD